MGNKYIEKLRRIEGAITSNYDPHANVIQTSSPSLNWTYGNGYGLPRGYSLALWGPPKGGKSLIANAMVGGLHAKYADSFAIKFDVEYRDEGQKVGDRDRLQNFGVDRERYVAYGGNRPEDVFDRLLDEIVPLAEDGMDLGLVIVDSFSMMQGRREAEQSSVSQHQIGDHAQTINVGLKRVLPYQRKYRFGLVVIAHARAELDMWKARKNPMKMQAAFGLQHHCEYFMMVQRNESKDGAQNELGESFVDNSRGDLRGKSQGEETGHRIRAWMQDSSMGPANRVGEFTLDRERGIVNQHEEVFRLGLRWGIVERSGSTYKFGSKTWKGKKAALEDLSKNPELQQKLFQVLQDKDKAGRFSDFDAEVAISRMLEEDAEAA